MKCKACGSDYYIDGITALNICKECYNKTKQEDIMVQPKLIKLTAGHAVLSDRQSLDIYKHYEKGNIEHTHLSPQEVYDIINNVDMQELDKELNIDDLPF